MKKIKLFQNKFKLKLYKFILWIIISIFFFIHFFNNNQQISTNSLKKVTISHPQSLNALSESTISQGFFNNFKIYVYELPATYNVDWLSNTRCRNHLFSSEVLIHEAIMKSDVRTFDYSEADLFFVPVYVTCNFSTSNGFPAIGHAPEMISSAIDFISSEFPFWNRSNGFDHLFVASHDHGACFHAMEDRAMANGIPEFMKNSIILQTFGVKQYHPCQGVDHVVIPPYVNPQKVQSTLSQYPVNGPRDIFVFFRGKMEVHPKNVSGRFYSKRVRTEILRKFGNDKRFYLKRRRFDGYQSEIARSVFCLCPLGWAPWSPRLVEAVALGCVPVIIADGIRLPFESAVPWPDISLTVPEKDVGKLATILEHVARTNLSSIQKNLWDPKVREALLYHDDVENGDATWQILVALSEKVAKSKRRFRALNPMRCIHVELLLCFLNSNVEMILEYSWIMVGVYGPLLANGK